MPVDTETDPEIIQPVKTVKRLDSRPTLEMGLEELSQREQELLAEDTSYDPLTEDDLESVQRVELHADHWDEDDQQWRRAIDGKQAEWDSQRREVIYDWDREDTEFLGVHAFEFVFVFDEAVESALAEETRTVPREGLFGFRTTSTTQRSLETEAGEDRYVTTLTVGTLTGVDDGPVALGGDLDADGNDITNVGSVDATSVGSETEPAEAVHSQTVNASEGLFDSLRAEHSEHDELEATSAEVEATSEPRPDATINEILSFDGRVQSSLSPVGTLTPTTPAPLLLGEETGITETEWTQIGSRYYGWMESPPNKVPIVRAVIELEHADADETLEVRILHTTHDESTTGDELVRVSTGGGSNALVRADQGYLNEADAPGTGYQSSMAKLTVEARVSGGSTGGTVYPSSSLILIHEVI